MRSVDASAERLDRQMELLLAAGRALTLWADADDAFAAVARAIVGSLAEYCEIEITGERDRRRRVTAGDAPPKSDPGYCSAVEQVTNGRTSLGTLTCVTTAPGGFDDMSRKALSVLAIELGIAAAGRELLEREHHVADRLQRALLPERLPPMRGAAFDAAYRPASDEADVGGDWYDAFHLPDGRVAISVGDVAGHGLEAAVIMGEVRQAIRTAAVAAESPSAVLEHVNQIIALRDSISMVTAIFGAYDPETSTLVYAVAGHPPPLLVLRNGMVRSLPGGSLPFGCTPALDAPDWTFTLPAGSQALFYTDGLVENERDVLAGEERLFQAARELVCRDAGAAGTLEPAEFLLDRIFCGAPNRDDVAVLCLSRTDPVPFYVLSGVPIAAPIARGIVGDELEALGVESDRRFEILLAVGEAIANAIEHGYRDVTPGLIRLALAAQDGELSLTVEDRGHWRPFVRRDHRGRGFQLMHAFMDGVQIQSSSHSTRVSLKTTL